MTHQGTILVVDDDHASLKLLTSILTIEGYVVRPADSGELALASIEANPPELVLTDVRMPGIDGLEVFRRIQGREQTRGVPFIFMSAVAEMPERVAALKMGAMDFISKPFQAEELLARVASRLESHRTREALRKSEERLSLVAEKSRTFIWECDAAGLYTYASPTSLSILGFPPEEIVGKKHFYDLHPDAGREAFKAAAFAVFARGDSFTNLENPVQTKEGRLGWVLTTGVPLLDPAGAHVGYRGSDIDITARKKTEEELRLNFETRAATNSLLSLSLHGGTIRSYLDQALEVILSLEWLSIESKGAIFLADDAGETLQLQTQKGFADVLLDECRAVPFGHCLCGRAAAERAVQFADRLDDRHDTRYEGMQPHGHYCLPMLCGDAVLGVICLYVEDGHVRQSWEADFLENAARTIGGVVKRLKAENALLASEVRYRRLFEAARDGILILDATSGMIVDVNPFLEELTGFSHEDFLGKHLWEIGSFKDIAASAEAFAELQAKEYIRYDDLPLVTRDGRKIAVEFVSNVYLVDGHKVIQCNVRDISARKGHAEELRQSEERFRILFEHAADCILLLEVGPDGMPIIRNANKAAFWTLGYGPDELLGQPITFLDAEPGADTVTEERREKISSGTGAIIEVRHRCKDGSTKEFECTVREITTGSKILAISVERDVTERNRIEAERGKLREQLRASQKLESIGTLASGVAHEINNPLNVIMNYGQLILDGTADPAEVKDYAENIVKESDRVAVIVRNLLAFARQERETYSPAPIADIVERTLSLTAAVLRRDQIAVQRDIPYGLPDIQCRSQQIQQVLMNLLTNARDALNQRYPGASEDKTIRIDASSFREDGERWVRLTVADHGGGIPADIHGKVFDPFFTTKPKDRGTGLGLSISYGIVKEHGGRLWFESEQGSGTRFHMDLKAEATEV